MRYDPVGAAPRHRRRWAASSVAWAAAWATFLAGAAVLAPRRPPTAAPDALAAAADVSAGSRCAATGAGDVVECRYGGGAFLALESVAAYFEGVGVSRDDALAIYLPASYVVTYSPSLVGVGAGGSLAFGLYLPEYVHEPGGLYEPVRKNGTFATFLVVAAFDGALRAAAVVTDSDADGGFGRSTTRFDAVKMVDPATVLAYSNVDSSEAGYLYHWAWRSGRPPERANAAFAGTSHDVQVARPDRGAAAPSAYWQTGDAAFKLRETATGAEIASHDVAALGCRGMNHVQLLDGDARALVSCRESNGVLLYDVVEEKVVWIAGGPASTLAVVDDRGATHPPGADVWAGQHNAEAFGGAIYMFDNAYGRNASSRLVRFAVENGAAVVNWTYELPFPYPYGYSEVFGDADLLPSGNVLTNWWPAQLKPTLGLDADLYFQEITPDRRVAWEMKFYDTDVTVAVGRCEADADAACLRSKKKGWKSYSVERFYDAPVVYDVATARGGLTFVAHASVKRAYASEGTWELLDASLAALASGRFAFAAHQQPTRVAVANAGVAATLRVSDKWAQTADLAVPRGR